MTLDYSNASSSSDDKLCATDLTFNNNSSDSDNSNKITEIIPPSPKWHRRYSTRIRNKELSNGKKCRKHVNAKSLESGTQKTLDTTDTQNIQPISARTIETSQTTSTEHDHDHDEVQISTSSEQIVTIQVETLTSDQTQILELVTTSPNSVQLPLIDDQLQSTLGAEPEPVITIELETPEEIPEDNTPDVNIQTQNESEDTLSSKLFHEEDFPPEYFQTTDDGISSDENVIDDYYEIEPNTGTVNLWQNQNFQLNPISNFSRDTELEEDIMNGWKKVKNDEVPDHSPFTDFDGLNFSTESLNLEDFFNQLFDEYVYKNGSRNKLLCSWYDKESFTR